MGDTKISAADGRKEEIAALSIGMQARALMNEPAIEYTGLDDAAVAFVPSDQFSSWIVGPQVSSFPEVYFLPLDSFVPATEVDPEISGFIPQLNSFRRPSGWTLNTTEIRLGGITRRETTFQKQGSRLVFGAYGEHDDFLRKQGFPLFSNRQTVDSFGASLQFEVAKGVRFGFFGGADTFMHGDGTRMGIGPRGGIGFSFNY